LGGTNPGHVGPTQTSTDGGKDEMGGGVQQVGSLKKLEATSSRRGVQGYQNTSGKIETWRYIQKKKKTGIYETWNRRCQNTVNGSLQGGLKRL